MFKLLLWGRTVSVVRTSPLAGYRCPGQPWYSFCNHSQEIKALDNPSQNDYTELNQKNVISSFVVN